MMCWALTTCIGNVGGIIGSYIYIGSYAPRYLTGYGCSIALAAAGIVAAVSLELALIRINKKRQDTTEEEFRSRTQPNSLSTWATAVPSTVTPVNGLQMTRRVSEGEFEP